MAHEVETMAFAHEEPWHGLGNRVDASVSVDEMLVAAGLDWTVGLHPLYATCPGAPGDRVAIPNKAALIRESDHRVLTVASPQWRPVQNREVLEFFREYAEAGGATLETAGSLRGGRTVWGLANLNHGFTVGSGDAVKGYVLLASHHELGRATTVRLTSVRVVCANTMALAVAGSKAAYSQSHLRDFDPEAARATLGLAHQRMARMELDAGALSQLRLSQFDTVRFLAKFFQPNLEPEAGTEFPEEVRDSRVQELLDNASMRSRNLHDVLLCNEKAPGALPGTGWGVLNAVTYWADHVAGQDSAARLDKSWFGPNGDLKLEIERGLLEMV